MFHLAHIVCIIIIIIIIIIMNHHESSWIIMNHHESSSSSSSSSWIIMNHHHHHHYHTMTRLLRRSWWPVWSWLSLPIQQHISQLHAQQGVGTTGHTHDLGPNLGKLTKILGKHDEKCGMIRRFFAFYFIFTFGRLSRKDRISVDNQS